MNKTELKKIIKANKINQIKLADLLKVSRITVNLWCTGKRKIPVKRALQINSLFANSYALNRWHLSNFLSHIKLNNEEFAAYYGVSVSTVKKWLTGKADIPLALKQLILWYPHKKEVTFSTSIQTPQN